MDDVITVFGGSGFVGRHVVRALAKRGKRVRVAMRRPHLGQDLRVAGDVGQIQLVQANVRFPDSIDRALEDATGVVNLVGVMHDQGAQNFRAMHVDAAEAIAKAAAARGLTRMAHISALGAAPKGARYAKTKYAGEQAVRAALPSATVLRPSIIFGPEDSFFNRFASMARFSSYVPLGALPLIGGGKTKFQPIYVGDVADAVCAALDNDAARGQTYELGGPRTYTFKELMQFVVTETERRVPLVPIPFFVAGPLGMLLEWGFKLNPLMDAPLTGDQVALLRRDNIVSADAHTIEHLGVTQLESVESIVPTYLWRFRPYGQFQTKQSA
ncbi:MAG TPA: complex I NDUFA9 subunit family protein [Caulobacterales bacterium]|nr:complex I NDUFA9 subunit family protein [Caulobacterales bacterium]